MGYLILSNGVPIGYGGSSVLFKQVNTGINIFDEFRGSEAAFIWTQVMRAYHSLTACTRFVANPYQFGGDNSEALRSGAFWFYYRLGYRPVFAEVRKLAQKEFTKIRRESAARVLKKLAKDIGMRSGSSGSKALAPIVAAVGPGNWSREDKRLTRELLRAKDGKREAHYARLLVRHDKLLFSLKKVCRRAD